MDYNNPDGLESGFYHHQTSPEPISPDSLHKDRAPSRRAPGQVVQW